MKLTREAFKEKLKMEAIKEDIALDEEQIDKLLKYKELILEWNQKINLTAIIDDEEIITKHFIDSLIITKHIINKQKLIDIGTGAGFPGVVLSIYFKENLDITLLEPVFKKVKFLNLIKKELNLNKIKIINDRAEMLLKKPENREKYDVVVARAVSKLNVLLEISIPFIKVSGKALFMKSHGLEEEKKEAQEAFKVLKCRERRTFNYKLKTKEGELERNVIEITKNSKTEELYPREYSKIKRNPL